MQPSIKRAKKRAKLKKMKEWDEETRALAHQAAYMKSPAGLIRGTLSEMKTMFTGKPSGKTVQQLMQIKKKKKTLKKLLSE